VIAAFIGGPSLSFVDAPAWNKREPRSEQ